MSRNKAFRVVKGRVHFKCYSCESKRMVAVPYTVLRRTIRCQKCGEITRCTLNRRITLRDQQRGKILMKTADGREMTVDLADVSLNGVGLDVSAGDLPKIKVGKEIQFRCTWNPRLLGQGRYVIRSIKGRRVGLKRRR
jgi:hypothetical protein